MTTEEIVKRLESFAKWDTITSEFSHEAHICWKAAREIERLLAAQWALDEANAKLQETIRQRWAYGCGPNTLAGSDDI
jgi:hypothetical protein